MTKEKLTGLGMKNSLKLPSLTNKYFNSLRHENDEPIYTYNDEFMRCFVRKSMKIGRCSGLNQYFKSTFSAEVFNIVSEELGVNGNIYEILDEYFEIKNKHRTTTEKNMIHNLKAIEITMKKEEPNKLTKYLSN